MASHDTQSVLLSVEVERRLVLPLDQWGPVGELSEITSEARAELAQLRQEGQSQGYGAQ